MTKAEFVDHVAAAVQVPKHQTEAVITRFLEAIRSPDLPRGKPSKGWYKPTQYLQRMLTTVLPASSSHGGREGSPPFP
jgi:hypothetical protein